MRNNNQKIKNSRREKEILREINSYISSFIDGNSILKDIFFTRVVTNAEEHIANVYFYKMGIDSDLSINDDIVSELKAIRYKIQQYINQKVKMKYPPKLKFIFDKEYLEYMRVNNIIESLKKEDSEFSDE